MSDSIFSTMLVLTVLVFSISYLIGAIPFGVIIARSFYHADIRQMGSRNTGATNVWRSLGWKPGLVTLVLDILKGAVPVLICRARWPGMPMLAVVAGLAAIIGHNWSVFLMGSGGKGVATSTGVFLALLPVEGCAAIVTFLVFFLMTKHVSVGSMAGAVALLITCLIRQHPPIVDAVVLLASAMILIKHIPNMKRLARGEEPKVPMRKKS